MEFAQKRMATQTWFTFDERELKHRVRDNTGEVEFSVEYSAIPAQKRIVFNRNNWLRNVGLLWCALGVVMIGLDATAGAVTVGSGFWIFIGLGCLAFYRLTWSEFTVLDTSEGPVWIIRDKQHNAILDLIHDRRKTQLLGWYDSLDFSEDPMREVHTIEWLVKQGVMAKSDGDARIAEIRKTHTILLSHSDDEPGPQLH